MLEIRENSPHTWTKKHLMELGFISGGFMSQKSFRTSLASVAALLVFTFAAHAEVLHFKSQLNGSSEVPANQTAGVGTLMATLDTTTHEFKYHVEYSGLSGPVTGAHFHGPAAAGVSAKPVLPAKASATGGFIEGTATLTSAQEKDLTDGMWYFNLHTAATPAGEIRGQVLLSSE
jgi:hypothetical protein